jgi:serine/threonine protein kinase
MYQMATGRLPFVADTPLAIVFKHVNAPLPSPQSINRTIPDVVNQIIVRTMEKSPDSRYQSAAELLKDLERVESGELLQSSKPGSESTPPFFPDASKDVAVVSLHVVETGQIITLDEGQEFVLGRVDEGMQNKPEIDLSAFQAFQKGVSRRHALVTLGEKKTVNLTDLNSTNGTWVNGTKIKAQIPMTLHHGDVISLGKLVIQVLVRL